MSVVGACSKSKVLLNYFGLFLLLFSSSSVYFFFL